MKRSTRIVYAAFDKGPHQRLVIPAASRVWDAVLGRIETGSTNRKLIGVLDQTKTKWID